MVHKYLVALSVVLVTFGTANADTFDWSFTSTDPLLPFITGSGTLDAVDKGGGTYLVDAVTGSVSNTCTGSPCVPQFRNIIDLLTPGQAYGGLSNIPGDNLVFPSGSPAFLSQGSNNGIVFSIDNCPFSAGCFMQIYFGVGQYELFASNGGANGVDFALTATSPVPAPIVGAGLPGLMLASGGLLGWWRRKRKVDAAAA
jgi:hypothetical protein